MQENKKNFASQLGFLAAIAITAGIGAIIALKDSSSIYTSTLSYNINTSVWWLIGAIIAIQFGPIPSEVPAIRKIKTSMSFLFGWIIIGMLSWPLISPATELDALTFFSGNISFVSALIVLLMAFLTGFCAYFITSPLGIDAAFLAVPAGLSTWALKSGPINLLFTANPSAEQRSHIYKVFRWEGFYWIILVLAGIGGAKLAQRLAPREEPEKVVDNQNTAMVVIVPLVAGVIATIFGLKFLAFGFSIMDSKMNMEVVVSPNNAQAGFACMVSMGIVTFVLYKFLKTGYLWAAISSSVTAFVITMLYGSSEKLSYIASHWPGTFFPSPESGTLPIVIVGFGSIGAVTGHWFGILYSKWQKENSETIE